jgi:hypothetical protein
MAPKEMAADLLQLQRRARPSLRRCPGLARPVRRLLERCLALDPRQRPASAAEVAGRLQHYFQHKEQQRARRKSNLVGGGLLLILALLSGGLFLSRQQAPEVSPSPVVSEPVSAATPPSEVRGVEVEGPEALFRRGRQEMRRGRPENAIPLFEKSLEGQLRDALAQLVGLAGSPGQGHLLGGSLSLILHRQVQQGPTLACIAYCYSLQKQHTSACTRASQAEASGFRSAALFSNRAYSYLQSTEISRAQADLQEALRLDPHLPSAHLSSIYLAVNRRLQQPARSIGAEDLAHVDRALAGRRKDPTTLLYAARLYTLAARDDAAGRQAYRDEAIEYLEKAILNGARRKILEDEGFKSLRQHPRYPELLALPEVERPEGPRSPFLVDPLAPGEEL